MRITQAVRNDLAGCPYEYEVYGDDGKLVGYLLADGLQSDSEVLGRLPELIARAEEFRRRRILLPLSTDMDRSTLPEICDG